jgi:hypothetical protein
VEELGGQISQNLHETGVGYFVRSIENYGKQTGGGGTRNEFN